MRSALSTILAVAATAALAAPALAQNRVESKSPLRFDHYRDHPTLVAESKALAAAHPDMLTYVELGKSSQGRPVFALILNNPKTGVDTDKPAMYIDGNIHGNEVNASETVLYTVWYLVEQYGKNKLLTDLVDRSAFYFVPCVNPDGRQTWFDAQSSPHSSRTGMQPTDDDRDGLVDEDGPDDLDGDGSIGMMWRRDPNGTHRRSELDPNKMERVEPEPRADGTIRRGEWSMAGREGIDNDGDGQVNDDGPGGYDMNRNWPADWQPDHVQGGAGDWPFSYPETESVGRFILTKPNIAAGQAYHNTGGMILRGPGAASRENAYAADRSTYDAIANAGVEMLPGYRSMVIHSDLYPVRGGFVNWLSESLGIVSFTNELWTEKRISQNGGSPDQGGMERWRERLLFDETRTPFTEVEHPTLGKVLVGGGTKWSSRNPPSWMLEEECHRNAAFTFFHAQQMPRVSWGTHDVKRIGDGLWEVTLEIKNDALIPTRTARAASTKAGIPDRITLSAPKGGKIAASGTVSQRFDRRFDPEVEAPSTVVLESGVPSRGSRFVRVFVEGKEGEELAVQFEAEKATDLSTSVKLVETSAKP
ncbi:MAG: M14 family metallopeptidase [Phycisphaerales bacterium]